MSALRILADDLTGALDTVAAFAQGGRVCLDRWALQARGESDAVEVVATATRDLPPAALPQALRGLADWLAGARIAFKKVDSLLRGNTFEELRVLAASGCFSRVLLAPALPAQGRTTLAGRLQVRGEPVAGPALQEQLSACGLPVLVPDIQTDADLDRCLQGPWAGPGTLLCGSAGLAHALARREAWQPAGAPLLAAAAGPTLLISASHHPVSRAQWALLADQARTWGLQEGVSLWRASERVPLAEVLDQAATARGLMLDLSPGDTLSPAAASQLLSDQVAHLVQRLPRPGRLLVVGGDTLRALLRQAQVQSLHAQPSPWGGWGQAQLHSGPWSGVPVHSRSGAFGAADDLLACWLRGSASGRLAPPGQGFEPLAQVSQAPAVLQGLPGHGQR